MPWPHRSNQQYDYMLGGKGFMLVRDPKTQGRSWDRKGTADIPYRFYQWRSGPYDPQPDEIDHAEVFNDWSGGAGQAYRPAEDSNDYLYSQNFDTRFPRQLIHAQALQLLPAARYSGSNVNCEYLQDVPLPGVSAPPAGAGAVLAYGRNWMTSFAPTSLLSAGSQFDVKAEATAQSFQGRPALFGSYAYIATGTGFLQRGFDGTTMTLNTSMSAQGFGIYRNTAWRRHSTNLLQSVAAGADPMVAGNWSATLSIGNGLNAINDLAERGDALFLGAADGLYQGDIGGSFFNVLGEARDVRHQDNGRDLTVYDGGLVFAGAPGMYWYQPSAFGGARGDSFEVGPQGATTGRTPVRGRNRTTVGNGPWLYAGMWTGSQSWLMGGRRDGDRQSPTGYTWHTLQLLPHTAKIHRIHFDSITNASGQYNEMPSRLWISTEASFGAQAGATAPLYVSPVPRLNQNPLLDLTFTPNYCGSARIDLPATSWQMPGVQKVFRAVEVWADNLMSGAQYCDLWVTVDSGARQYAGRATQSPKSTVFLPGDNGTFLSGQSIQLSLESYTASSLVTPVYRSLVVRGAVRPRSVDVITAVTHIADGLIDRWGTPMRDGGTMIQELRSMGDPLQAGGAQPVSLLDLAGATQWVVVLPAVQEQELHQAGERPPEVAATVRMAVLDFTQSYGPGISLDPILQVVGGGPAMN